MFGQVKWEIILRNSKTAVETVAATFLGFEFEMQDYCKNRTLREALRGNIYSYRRCTA